MEETMIWVTGLIVELLLISTVVLAVLLRRSRRAHEQLLAEHGEQKPESAPATVAVETVAPVPAKIENAAVAANKVSTVESVPAAAVTVVEIGAPGVPPATQWNATDDFETEIPDVSNASITHQIKEILVGLDDARVSNSVGRLQQRIESSGELLERLASGLQSPADVDGTQPEVASLQQNLQEITQEVGSLQQNNAELQQELRRKAQAAESAAAKVREETEMVMQHAHKLRGDVTALRDKLKDSQGDAQRLLHEKAALAAELEALNKEYEKIYSGRK